MREPGYTGGAFDQAVRLTSAPWAARDIVTVGDISGDGVADLVYRNDASGQLLLRTGIASGSGGVSLTSLAIAANSATGSDTVYGTGGWSSAGMPLLLGTPDATGDGIPDFWAAASDGVLYLYPGGRTAHGTRYLVGESGWTTLKTLG
ncbi:hypothetical protein [Streptomyces sp. NPDC003393]